MSTDSARQSARPTSIRQINALPDQIKRAFYCALVPRSVLAAKRVGSEVLLDRLTYNVRCPENTGSVEIDVRHPIDDTDPVVYVQMADTFSGQLEVLLMMINDPTAPRFATDRDWKGEPTKFGTMTRNREAETLAMEAGLAPGQVRRGLGLGRELVPAMERFAASLGKNLFFIEPLTYHNAVLFERYGFAYVTGQAGMVDIQRGFQPGEELWQKLDGSNAFRMPTAAASVRGRSWAIHDGILGHPWTNIRMYKRLGQHAGISTFPDGRY